MSTYRRRLERLARRHGAVAEQRRSGHYRIVTRDGRLLTASGSPKNADIALRNVERDITDTKRGTRT